MKWLFILSVIISACVPVIQCRGVNGGMSCAVCTVLMGVAMQVAEVHEEDLVNATKKLCGYLPKFAQNECLQLTSSIEPALENLSKEVTPDIFCLVYGTCKVEEGEPLCHLFPLPFLDYLLPTTTELKLKQSQLKLPDINFCDWPVISDICAILNNSYTNLDAAADFDQDGFSTITTARGADWKGRDCLDSDEDTYPGRQPYGMDVIYDSNCNGIWGIDNKTGRPWEEILCSQSDAKGLIYIGDSIGAHFHMPQVWINPIEFSFPGLNASDVILDELDWPQYGFATGYRNITPNILIKGPTDSLYTRLRNRNRCNHRDYQNLSQNGASSFEGIQHALAISRNQTTDNPAIVIYAMQGNDVCNNFKDTVSNMTKPEVFKSNVLQTLDILNSKLPKHSHVVLMGLVNADFIYDAMAKLLHPIGILHRDVHYKDLYNWFNCMQIGPCTGWLNSDESLRITTTQKANELTKILREIASTKRYDFFSLHFIENPINYIIRHSEVNVPNLLEAVDSLHPNQRAQPMLAEVVWNNLENDLPSSVLGPTNKQNKLIKTIFGNQGGH